MTDSSFLSLLAGRGCRFTVIPPSGTPRSNDGNPYTGKAPQGKAWQKVPGGSNYALDDPELQKARGKGWGIGLVCGTGGVVPFDADALSRLEELGIVAKLPATIEVESRPDHRHRYYVCPDLTKKFAFYDPIKTETDQKSGEQIRAHLGEVLGPGGHAVLPGTQHPTAGTVYHVVSGCPEELAELSMDDLRNICRGLAFSIDPNKNPTFNQAAGLTTMADMKALEEIEAKAQRTRRGGGSLPSLSAQIGDIRRVLEAYHWTPKRKEGNEWKGEPPGHNSESGDSFQVNIKSGLWHCKRCNAGGDAAALVALFGGLITCDGAEDLSRDSGMFAKTLETAKNRGLIESEPTTGPAPETEGADILELIDFLPDRTLEDPGAPFDPEVLELLATVRDHDPANWARIRAKLKKAKVKLTDLEACLCVISEARIKAAVKAEEAVPKANPEIVAKAWALLEGGELVDSIITATSGRMQGGEDLRRLAISSATTAYLDGAKLHLSTVGDSQSGKTSQTDEVLRHFPGEDVITLAEVSPKAFYYMSKNMDFDNKIVRINDAREAHIPVIKIIEDDSPIPATNYTVYDGEGIELTIRGDPVLWSTSVGPLTDRDGQTVSRSLMISPDKIAAGQDRTVKGMIWHTEQFGDLLDEDGAEALAIHQEAFRILREGGGAVLVPFKVEPPTNCSRRGVRQFATLIKSLAFINQYQRIRLSINDKRYILANYADFSEAARLWYAFFDLQTHKSGGKRVVDVLVCLLAAPPNLELGRDDPTCRTPKEIAELSGLPGRTVNDYLKDLYEAGYIDRAKVRAPGPPYAYWLSAKSVNMGLPRESATGDSQVELGELGELTGLPRYVGKNSSELLKDSSPPFFSLLGNNKSIRKERRTNGAWVYVDSSVENISLSYAENFSPSSPMGPTDSDQPGETALADRSPRRSKIEQEIEESEVRAEEIEEHFAEVASLGSLQDKKCTMEGETLAQVEAEIATMSKNAPGGVVTPREIGQKCVDHHHPTSEVAVIAYLVAEGWTTTGETLNGDEMYAPPNTTVV